MGSQVNSLKINVEVRGEELKKLQIKYVNLLPNFNEIKDKCSLVVSARKARIEDLTASAILAVKNTDEFKETKSTVQAKIMNAMIRTYKQEIGYQKMLDKNRGAFQGDDGGLVLTTTISDEEHLLNLDYYGFNRAKSRCDELDQILWVCRSALSFDKIEINHSSGT